MTNKYTGLTSKEAEQKLKEWGRNELVRTSRVRPFKILLSQFTSPLILVLIAAALISLTIGFFPNQEANTIDVILIMTIVLVSGIFGFIQDYEAERTIEALQEMSSPSARVIRDNNEIDIPSAELVPGDILLLSSGDMVTADARLLETFHIEIDESVLTGESHSISKNKEDLIYSNTYVTTGNATAIVTQTGMNSRLGQVASKLQELTEEKSSFEKELMRLGKTISILTLIIGLLIAVVGFFKFGFYNSLLTAISLAVAAIPEGLPAVVVMALAAGANIMVKKKALIRKLSIVESIGSVDVICTDKTGTLTKNEMTVVRLHYDNEEFDILKDAIEFKPDSTGELLLKCGLLCNNTTTGTKENGEVFYHGKQTEIALKKISEKTIPHINFRNFLKVQEISFNSERKMMSVVVLDQNNQQTLFSKGAPELLIFKCSHIVQNSQVVPFTEEMKQSVLQANIHMASQALRVLGFAYRPVEKASDAREENLIWIGLQGMIDPPSEEVEQALHECKLAGIRVIMITGDNAETAKAISAQIGLKSNGLITGDQLDKMNEAELALHLKNGVNIFARTSPFHKLKILKILEINHNVAMTGDGVNDALAIKNASVGIAMGRKGTEVAKQASDIVLLDDNFKTIKDAVKQGRTIFNNIRKFINYLLTCNTAEVAVIFVATLTLSLESPILFPVQILWINLLTDGLVALALGVDPPANDVMKKNPRSRNEPIINNHLWWLIGLVGSVMTIMLLLTFVLILNYAGEELARSALFAGFVLYEFVRIASIRYQEKMNWLANKWLIMALFGSLIFQILVIYTPVNQFFYVVPLGWDEWLILLAGSVLSFGLILLITKAVIKWVPQ